jgi:hypothetical protein
MGGAWREATGSLDEPGLIWMMLAIVSLSTSQQKYSHVTTVT